MRAGGAHLSVRAARFSALLSLPRAFRYAEGAGRALCRMAGAQIFCPPFRQNVHPSDKNGYFAAARHRYNEGMNYIKKLCILKQVSPGFAADGRAVSALLTCEQFAGRVTLTLAMIGFAPLTAGRYRCVVCDGHGTAEVFDVPSPAGAAVRRESALDVADGLGCAVFFVHGHAACAAFGKCGDGAYDLKRFAALLEAEEAPAANAANAAARTSKGKRPARGEDTAGGAEKDADKNGGQKGAESVHIAQNAKDEAEAVHAAPPPEGYDDELVADENYYAFANGGEDGKDEADGPAKAGETDAGTDAHDQSLFRFAGAEMLREDERACYYDTVRAELEGLFAKYPPETALEQSIPRSRWARVDFAAGKYYVVGVVRGETHPLYICYGVPAERRQSPPEPLKKYSSYVPVSLFAPDGKGYWMMFQDAETGRCIHLTQT